MMFMAAHRGTRAAVIQTRHFRINMSEKKTYLNIHLATNIEERKKAKRQQNTRRRLAKNIAN